MYLPLYRSFSEEQKKKYGPTKKPVVLTTERNVYQSPFMYENVGVGDFYEVDAIKGIEFKADTGFLMVKEDKPIVAVTVVGSGCTPKGYNICEWWDDGESVEKMKDQLVKRQRVDNLNGTHPSIWSKILMGVAGDRTFDSVSSGDIKTVIEALRKLSDGFYEGYYLGFYENTAYFRLGPPYPHKVTIRCGCKIPEDPGTSIDRYPGDYAIRVVETTVITDQH